MRVHTKSRPAGKNLPDDVPNFAGYSLKFMTKLFAAWIEADDAAAGGETIRFASWNIDGTEITGPRSLSGSATTTS